MSPITQQDAVQAVAAAVESGEIARADYKLLVSYYATLAGANARQHLPPQQFDIVLDAVRFHTLRSVVKAFEKRTLTQWVVTVIFAVLAIAATLAPYFIAPNPSDQARVAPTAPVEPTNKSTQPPQKQPRATSLSPNTTSTKSQFQGFVLSRVL